MKVVVGLVLSLIVAAPATAQVVNFPKKYPLEGSKTKTVQGARTNGSCQVPAGSATLQPGQGAVEVRETQLDPSTCKYKLEQGKPPKSALGPAPPQPKPSNASPTSVGATSTHTQSGFTDTWYVGLGGGAANRVRAGAQFDYNERSCAVLRWGWTRRYWERRDGWYLLGHNNRYQFRCRVGASAFAHFRSNIFCDAPIGIGGFGPVGTWYNRTNFFGYANGMMIGTWNPSKTGNAGCTQFLAFHARVRENRIYRMPR